MKTTENPKYDGYQCGLTSMAYINFSIKRFQVLLLKKKLCRTSKVGDLVRISEYKTKATLQREVFVIKKNLSWTYVISNLNSEETVGIFYKKQL